MLFSIVTASYNSGDEIRKTYNSLLLQNHEIFEWIIVDGGSEAYSCGVLQELVKSAPFAVQYVSEADDGVFDAFNKGLKIACGKWIGFLGCGDEYYPGVLESIANSIGNADDHEVVYGIIDFVRQDGAHYWYTTDEKYLDEGRMMHHAATFVKKDMYVEIGGFNIKYKSASDLDAFIKLKRAGARFAFVPYIVTKFNAGGLSTTGTLPYEERMEIMHEYGMLTKKMWIRFIIGKRLKKLRTSIKNFRIGTHNERL
ncbi:MAG TPA: glycosyltransferase [Rectinema sp.]|nr:glycosyltransferase [Rectinema sp.]